MNQEIKFICSHCEQKMLVDASAIGLTINCPSCGKELIVPAESMRAVSPPSPVRPRTQVAPAERPAPRSSTVAETISGTISPADSRQDLIAASVQNSRLESEVTELRQQLKKARSDFNRVSQERDEAISRVHQLTPQLDSARSSILGYEQTVDALQQQILQAEADVVEARQRLGDTQSERTVAMREIQGLQQRVSEQEQELASLWAELNAATGKGQALEAELAKVRENLTAVEHASELLKSELADLGKERDSLRRSVSESGLGQELVSVRELLAASEKECKRLSLNSRQLTSDVNASEKALNERADLIRTLKKELENARLSAESSSESKTDNDYEVLRGIIARQNSELQQKHAQLVRLKRARLGVQFVYALFALALASIIIWAVKVVPKLKPGSFFDF
jgi:chromosome segregation ATPase